MSTVSLSSVAPLETLSVSLDLGEEGSVFISAEIHNNRMAFAQNTTFHLLRGDMLAVNVNDASSGRYNPCDIELFFENTYLPADPQSYYCIIKSLSLSSLNTDSDIIIEAMDMLREKAVDACLTLNKETNHKKSRLNIVLGLSTFCCNASREMCDDMRRKSTPISSALYTHNDLIATGLQFEPLNARYCPSNRFLVAEEFQDSFLTYIVSLYVMSVSLNAETRANPRKKKHAKTK